MGELNETLGNFLELLEEVKLVLAVGLSPSGTTQYLLLTERVGFEPTEAFTSNDFESFAFDHSATSP